MGAVSGASGVDVREGCAVFWDASGSLVLGRRSVFIFLSVAWKSLPGWREEGAASARLPWMIARAAAGGGSKKAKVIRRKAGRVPRSEQLSVPGRFVAFAFCLFTFASPAGPA